MSHPYGAPRFTPSGLEVLKVTLHRYLAPFLVEHQVQAMTVAVGFEGSLVPPACLDVTASGATLTERTVDFARLAAAVRDGNPSLSLADESGERFVAVGARGSDEHSRQYVAFGLLPVDADIAPESPATGDLAARLAEATRAFRFTGLRLLFDERDQVAIKDFLYGLLDRLPEWCGVDHSAALILTGELEAMALNSSANAAFEIVSERLFMPRHDANGKNHERLVGLVIDGQGASSGLLGYAFDRAKSDRAIGLQIFVPNEAGDEWHLFAEPEARARRFATRVNRPLEGMTVLVPLLLGDELRGTELLGFLSLNYTRPTPIDSVAAHLLEDLASKLARYIQRSPLFSLSARQLLLIESVRSAYNKTIGEGGAVKRLDTFVDAVSELITKRMDVPCFAIGYISGRGADAQIRFVSPRGFTRFDEISVPVHSSKDDVQESTVAALAVRMGRAIVLSGGRPHGDTHTFNNELWVNEESGEMADGRRGDPSARVDAADWKPLSAYYKPSRDDSYATLAFPISIGNTALGVIAVEVDRATDWLWWTGFGSQIFYRLLANELAVAFKLMGVPHL